MTQTTGQRIKDIDKLLDIEGYNREYAAKIADYQEKFAAAFLKETGLKATEVVMNIQQCSEHNQGFWGTRIWFEKKDEVKP